LVKVYMNCNIVLEYLTKLEELSNSTSIVAMEAQELMTKRINEYTMKRITALVDENY